MTTFADFYAYDWVAKAQEVFKNNEKWWKDLETGEMLQRNPKTLLALMESEVAEGLEGIRKDRNDDHLPHRKMIEVELADHLIRTLDFIAGMEIDISTIDKEVELPYDLVENFAIGYFEEEQSAALYDLTDAMHQAFADGYDPFVWYGYILTIGGFASKFNYDILGAMEEKLEYNKHREDHKVEARKLNGGKKF